MNKKKLYLHYSFKKYTMFLLGGMKWRSYGTRDVYPTGWLAKWRLALRHVEPPDSVFIVYPRLPASLGITGPTTVLPKYGMGGGGNQYRFWLGSGGAGTVAGPIPLLKGEFGEW